MITATIAQTLRYGQTLVHNTAKQNGGKTPLRVRVTGKVKLWKTRPDDFKIPVKHGLCESGYVDHTNGQYWTIEG